MKLCSLSGLATKSPNATGAGDEVNLLCPLAFLGLSPIKGAVCGAYGSKSSHVLTGCLWEAGVLDPLNANRNTFEARFEVPRDDYDARLYKDELSKTTTINMLRLRVDALDYINQQWRSYFSESPPESEACFPRTPTIFPHLLENLRRDLFPNAELIIFPVKIMREIVALGAFFEPTKVQNIAITM